MLRIYQARSGGTHKGYVKKDRSSASREGKVAELIEEPYRFCVSHGMRPQDFWDSTMYEISVYMEGIRNKEECKFKDLHYLASLVRVAIVSAFDKDGRVKVPTYEELVSGNTSERSNIYHGWEESKAYMKAIQEVRTK